MDNRARNVEYRGNAGFSFNRVLASRASEYRTYIIYIYMNIIIEPLVISNFSSHIYRGTAAIGQLLSIATIYYKTFLEGSYECTAM